MRCAGDLATLASLIKAAPHQCAIYLRTFRRVSTFLGKLALYLYLTHQIFQIFLTPGDKYTLLRITSSLSLTQLSHGYIESRRGFFEGPYPQEQILRSRRASSLRFPLSRVIPAARHCVRQLAFESRVACARRLLSRRKRRRMLHR